MPLQRSTRMCYPERKRSWRQVLRVTELRGTSQHPELYPVRGFQKESIR